MHVHGFGAGEAIGWLRLTCPPCACDPTRQPFSAPSMASPQLTQPRPSPGTRRAGRPGSGTRSSGGARTGRGRAGADHHDRDGGGRSHCTGLPRTRRRRAGRWVQGARGWVAAGTACRDSGTRRRMLRTRPAPHLRTSYIAFGRRRQQPGPTPRAGPLRGAQGTKSDRSGRNTTSRRDEVRSWSGPARHSGCGGIVGVGFGGGGGGGGVGGRPQPLSRHDGSRCR